MVFSQYHVETEETGAAFFTFVLVYTGFAYFLIAPLVSWGRYYAIGNSSQDENPKQDFENDADPATSAETEAAPSEPLSSTKPESSASSPNLEAIESQKKTRTASDRPISDYASAKTLKKHGSKSKLGIVLRELDRVAAAEYSDLASRISGRAGRSTVGSRTGTRLSSVSAATTSRLQSTDRGHRPATSVWDVGGRRWKNRRPIGRVDVIQNAISHEAVGSAAYFERKSSFSKRPKIPPSRGVSLKNMSDVASSVLEEQSNDGRTLVFSRSTSLNRSRFRLRRGGSFSSGSERSHMPSIVDDISPNDAADANDPGIGNIFQGVDTASDKDGFGVRLGCLSSSVESLLTLAEPETEIIRVWRLSIPLTLGAISEPLFRLVTMAFISNYLGTESMIAYLLVNLFVRLTSEQLSGAIIDALSSFVEAVLHSADGEGSFIAGQYVQHAILLQVLLGVPLLAVWAFLMGDVVEWLVRSTAIANIAEDYTRMVIFGYLAQALGRTATVVFHICGYERFESVIDFSTSTLTMLAVACIVSLVEDSSLVMVGYVQLLTGIAAAMAKISYPVLRGWMRPFWKGMALKIALIHVRSNGLTEFRSRIFYFVSNSKFALLIATQNPAGLLSLCYAAVPLLVGSILEYGEVCYCAKVLSSSCLPSRNSSHNLCPVLTHVYTVGASHAVFKTLGTC